MTPPLSLDPYKRQHVCSSGVAQAVRGAVGCPASTIVGSATAVTPLLDRPLTGPAYLVQGIRFNKQGQRIRTLPSLLVPLRGQIALDLRAQTSVDGASRLVTTFASIPDAAVSRFTLQINGGPRGIIVITGRGRSICNSTQTTLARAWAPSRARPTGCRCGWAPRARSRRPPNSAPRTARPSPADRSDPRPRSGEQRRRGRRQPKREPARQDGPAGGTDGRKQTCD